MVQITGERRTGPHCKVGSHVCSGTRLSSILTTLWSTPTGRGAWASITTAGKTLLRSLPALLTTRQIFVFPLANSEGLSCYYFRNVSPKHTNKHKISFQLGALWCWFSELCFPVWSLPCLLGRVSFVGAATRRLSFLSCRGCHGQAERCLWPEPALCFWAKEDALCCPTSCQPRTTLLWEQLWPADLRCLSPFSITRCSLLFHLLSEPHGAELHGASGVCLWLLGEMTHGFHHILKVVSDLNQVENRWSVGTRAPLVIAAL